MRRFFCTVLAAVMLVMLLSVGVSLPEATAAARAPYMFAVDSLSGAADRRPSGEMLKVVRDVAVVYGEDLHMTGWFSTPSGVTGYEYICTPAGNGMASWKAVPEVKIYHRPDLETADIPYGPGHRTAGFALTVPLGDSLAEGYYDIYLRALAADGSTLDFLALLRVRYGAPDEDDGAARTVSFERILREGAAAIRGAASVAADGIRLAPGGAVRLGTFHLPALEAVTIRYTTEAPTETNGRRAILGLKTTGDHPYGTLGAACHMTDTLVYAPIGGTDACEVTMDLTEIDHSGDVWLTGSLGGEVTITDILFFYNGKATDRVAAKLHLSGDAAKYLSGQNAVSAQGIADPTVGDCLRIEVTQDTNDPYVHFSAGLMMEDEADVRLDADEYKYLVLLLRAAPENLHAHMTLYLCAGTISGATEACTKSFSLERDGQWHYYLIDLTETEHWTGIVNGWRFDIINGNSLTGNYVDVATVQLFRTVEAARAVAAENPAGVTPYRLGEPAVIRDMREEAGAEADYTVPPEDTYLETTPDTEPGTEAPVKSTDTASTETAEAVTSPGETPTDRLTGSETEGEGTAGRGCASLAAIGWLPAVAVVAAWAAGRKNGTPGKAGKQNINPTEGGF